MAISVLKSGVYAQVTLVSLPSLDNSYLPLVSGDSGYPTDNSEFLTFLTGRHFIDSATMFYFPRKTFDMVTVKEGQSWLNIPLSLTECRQYNYVCMKNSEMVYYYWIVDYECMNAEVTRIHLLEDTVQTWFPYVTNFRGQLARAHFRRAILPSYETIKFSDFTGYMINPDMYSVDDQASDIDYLHCLCETNYVGSGKTEQESYCLVILNPPLSNWFTFQSHTTKWFNTSKDYPSYEVAVNQLDKEYATDSEMLSLITEFSSWASSNLTGYETLTVVDSDLTYGNSSSGRSLTLLAFGTTEGNTPMNTASYGGYDQYVYLAVKYNLLQNFFQSFPQLSDYIVEIVQLPKGFDIRKSSGKWIDGFQRILCTRADKTNSISRTYSVSATYADNNLHGFFYLITDISALRFQIDTYDNYTFASQSYDVPEVGALTDGICMRQCESDKIELINESSFTEYNVYPFVGSAPVTGTGVVNYPQLSAKSIYSELKLDLYPYKYWTYEFYGGIPIDVYYNNLMFSGNFSVLGFGCEFLGGVDLLATFNFSLDVSSVPTWSVNYDDDLNTLSSMTFATTEENNDALSLREFAYWQSDDIVATTYSYSYDSWSEYANYSKALTESNLKYKEQSAYISVGSAIAGAAINTAVSAATLGLGSAVSTTMSAKNIASSATGVIGNVANTANALAQQRAKVANNASQLARRTPNDKGSKSNRSSYYNKVTPLDDDSNTADASRGYGPRYPGVILTVNYASKAQQETVFRNCDLYGYIAPYYIPSMERGSSEYYGIYYSRFYRNYVQWEKVDLRFDADAPKPTYDEVEDLKARLINGVNFVHLPMETTWAMETTWGVVKLGDDIYYESTDRLYEMLAGFPEYENLDTLANTDSGYQEGPYFRSHGDFHNIP